MASIRRNVATTRRDEENLAPGISASGGAKRQPLGSRGPTLSRAPLTTRSGSSKPSIPSSSSKQSSQSRRTATFSTKSKSNNRVSQDKENQRNHQQKDSTKKKSSSTTTSKDKTALRTPSVGATTTTTTTNNHKNPPPSSNKSVVAFTPATKQPETQRGSGLNSLRRSLRESITPPNQKKQQQREPAAPTSNLPTTSTRGTSTPSLLDKNHTEDTVRPLKTLQVTPSIVVAPTSAMRQLPKTPKSMLKEQLDLSMEEESMLLSPGFQPLKAAPALAPPQKRTIHEHRVEVIQEQHAEALSTEQQQDNITPKQTTTQPTSHSSVEHRDQEVNHAASAEQSKAIPKQKTLDMNKSVFSATRRNARSELQKSKMKSNNKNLQVTIVTENPPQVEESRFPDHETPYAIHDLNLIQYKTQPTSRNEGEFKSLVTPYNKRGNGVCMDLTSMFFNEQKTIRKGNKKSILPPSLGKEEDAEKPRHNNPSGVHEALTCSNGVPNEEEWAERQCETFSKWLNYTLQPNNEEIEDDSVLLKDQDDGQVGAVAIGEPKSPSALRTLILHQRMAKARAAASHLFLSEDMQKVRNVIHSEVEKGKLAIRADRDMYADLTLRKRIVSLLLAYSTPWLRVALETLFNETILPEVPSQFSPVKRSTPQDQARKVPASRLRVALRDFIVNRVLSDATVLAKYTKGRCKVPSGNFEKRYRAEMRSLVLSRLFVLFFFLDRAKKENIIEKSPRLFTKSAQVKSSRDILISFCRDFLASEGDITKHLSRVGLKVSYKQHPIDEIEFGITNFAVDLRDGIRLTKLAEILTGAKLNSLLSSLRIPAVSRLQKLHNVGVALRALQALPVPEDVAAHHIVDGHRAMVMKLMWTIIAHYCFPAVLDFGKVEEEIAKVHQELQGQQMASTVLEKLTKESTLNESSVQDKGKELLLRWCQAVCALFGLHVSDFSDSFADGKALCYLFHYYHPNLLPLDSIRPTTKDPQTKRISADQARYNERINSNLAHTKMTSLGGVPNMMPTSDTTFAPDERSMMVYLCYAFTRLLASRSEVQACLVIQRQYREHQARLTLARKTRAGLKICEYWQNNKENYYRNQRLRYANAVAKIEAFVAVRKDVLRVLRMKRIQNEITHEASTLIQNHMRCFLARRHRFVLAKQYTIAVNLQRKFRRDRAVRVYKDLLRAHSATLRLQRLWRGFQARQALSVTLSSIVLIQAFVRGAEVRRQLKQHQQASVCIQKYWRGFWDQLQFQMDLMDIVAVQNICRRQRAMRMKKKKCQAILVLQLAARRFLALRSYHHRRDAVQALLRGHDNAITVQRMARAFLARKLFAQCRMQHRAATVIQQKWITRQIELQNRSRCIIQIQSIVRGWISWKELNYRRRAVSFVQCAARCYLARKSLCLKRSEQCFLASTVVFCQAFARRNLAMKRYASVQHSAIVIQSLLRGQLARDDITRHHQAATLIQSHFRRHICEEASLEANIAIIVLQSFWRSKAEELRYIRIISSVKKIQAFVRGHRERENVIQHKVRRMIMQNVLSQGQAFSKRDSVGASVIQSWWRAQSQFKKDYQKREEAAVLIQSTLRRKMALKRVGVILNAILVIQGFWRGIHLMRRFHKGKTKAVKIQALVRGHISRRKIYQRIQAEATVTKMLEQSSKLRVTTSTSSQIIQATWRSFCVQKQYHRTKRCIVSIQALALGFLARRRQIHRRRQVVKVQAIVRRIQQQQAHTQLVRGVCRLQSTFRNLRLKKNEEERIYRRSQKCATILQSGYRGYRVRQQTKLLHRSAAVIQKSWRGFVTVVNYHTKRINVISGQSYARRWLAQRETARRRDAIVELQSMARMFLSFGRTVELRERKREAKRINSSVTSIQRVFRGHTARKGTRRERAARNIQKCWRCYTVHVDFLISLLSAMTIQSLTRGMIARRSYRAKHTAIPTIQMHFRGMRARRRIASLKLEKQRKAAETIQCSWRRAMVKNELKIKNLAATDIQKVFRQYVASFSYNMVLFAVLQVQDAVRAFLANQALKRLENERLRRQRPVAAGVIQAAFRNVIAKVTFRRLRNAIIRLQAMYRGRRVRRRGGRRILITAERIKQANLRAIQRPNMKLGARCLAALEVIATSSRLAEIMTAVCGLEMSTRFSKNCCEAFVRAKAGDILLGLVRQCNRSLPHVELLSFIMRVFWNVSKHNTLLTHVATVSFAQILLDLIQMFRDKDQIFCLSVSLLASCIKYDDECFELCSIPENRKRLKGVHTLLSKKLTTSSRRMSSDVARKYIPGASLKPGMPSLKEGQQRLKSIIAYLESSANQ